MRTTQIDQIAPIDHDEAMRLAETEYRRVLDVAVSLDASEWSQPTDCPGWSVKDVYGHLLGMMKRSADAEEADRQAKAAVERLRAEGGNWLDCLTAIQVQEHADATPSEIVGQFESLIPAAVAGRRDHTAEELAAPFTPPFPDQLPWTLGYLLDLILTRDPWMHRVDVVRAIGGEMTLTPDHDGRIVADIVAEWGRRHGRPCTLRLGGAAGGSFVAGGDGPVLELDAVEFGRIMSGRSRGDGLLTTLVPF